MTIIVFLVAKNIMSSTETLLAQLAKEKCAPLKGHEHATSAADAKKWLAALPGWSFAPGDKEIRK